MKSTLLNNLTSGLVLALIFPLFALSQPARDLPMLVDKNPPMIIDYASNAVSLTRVPFRGVLPAGGRLSGTPAVFEVEYINFEDYQRDAFQYAVDLWSQMLSSDVPIRIRVEMEAMGEGVLGAAGAAARYANFPNAQKVNTFYAVAMAEKMAGMDLNDPSEPDIVMNLNYEFTWYYGTDGNTPVNKFDFVSVVMHEIGHGLGFIDGMGRTNDGTGYYTVFGAPMVYDRHIETADQQNVVDTYTDGTAELGDVLVGGAGDLFFRSFNFPDSASRPQLYAPATWSPGSSIAHLDEAYYPEGDPNSLMSPRFNYGESIHDPGLALYMMADMGWVAMDIAFDKLLDSEDSLADRAVVLTVRGDSAVQANGVNLHYTYTDFTNEVVVNLTPTGNANEYSGVIPATGAEVEVKYYISVNSTSGQVFTSPGEAPDYYWTYALARDTIAPEILHDSIPVMFAHEPVLPLQVRVRENMGLADLLLSYRVNGGTLTTLQVPLTDLDSSGYIVADYLLNWDLSGENLSQGDVVEYKLSISDKAGTPNTTQLPATGYYSITVEQLNPPVTRYENDFNAPTTDFVGPGFRIITESGFVDGAIHSDHPYRTTDGTTPADTLTLYYMLKTPVILSDKDASLVFDEVVLIEPGVSGSVYGDDRFWDYAIVEASKDFGKTWQPVADGYDSREQQVWLDQWESDMDSDGNSLAVGDPSLFVKKEYDMTTSGYFMAGDTVLIRFRIYADQLAHGWGWAIDNLRIQVDEKPPVVTQITPNYLLVGASEITLKSKVTDNVSVDSVTYELNLNGQVQYASMPGGNENYTLNVSFGNPVSATDVFKYRIIAVDKAQNPNTTIAPETGYFEVPVAVLGETRDMYINDFNTTSDDFVGANFSITQPDRFDNPALMSASPYPDAPFGTYDIAYLLKYPIRLKEKAAFVQYDEGVLTEPGGDQVAIDVSQDNGLTWIPVFDPYDASAVQLWQNIFEKYDDQGNSTGYGEPFMIQTRTFNLLDNPQLSGGDVILIRFRMTVNDSTHGWGWLIDNLEIQGPATGLADEQPLDLRIYPNPVVYGTVAVEATLGSSRAGLVLTDVAGRQLRTWEAAAPNHQLYRQLDLSGIKPGIYLLTLTDGDTRQAVRLMIR